MRRVIDGKTYNTETADEVCTLSGTANRTDFRYHDTSMYRTKGGAFFLAGEGGPMSMWAQAVEQNSWSSGKGIKPLTREEALSILEQENEQDAIEQYFGEMPEAAEEDGEVHPFALRLPAALKARAAHLAAGAGLSLNAWIVQAVTEATGKGISA